MTVPDEYTARSVYHFTSVFNLDAILEHGFLSKNEQAQRGLSHNSVAYNEIQKRRAEMKVTCSPGGVVHDYVPFYFCKRSPMLHAVVQNKIADQQAIIYFEFPLQALMSEYAVVFTDASANTGTSPNFFNNPNDLSKLDWNAIDTWSWGKKFDVNGHKPVMQAKQAELLVHTSVDPAKARTVIVWSDRVREIVLKKYEAKGLKPPNIVIGNVTDYFKNTIGLPGYGPGRIRKEFDKTVATILPMIGKAAFSQWSTLGELLADLEADMSHLAETAELVGLESANDMHKEDVGTHTQNVVKRLIKLPEYKQCEERDKVLLRLAAYLHDIGKGPKSRWANFGGKQQVDPDHPVKALPMLQRILTEDIDSMRERSVRMLCMLVCYHDLVGDIVGKGRRAEELEALVKDETELNLLIALGKADMSSVNAQWGSENTEAIAKLRERVIAKLKEL